MKNYEIRECMNLINANFPQNRFDDYRQVVIVKRQQHIVGFVGIYNDLLNQLCTHIDYRKQGIATEIIKICKEKIKNPIYLYIDKNRPSTEKLLDFYIKNKFVIFAENDLEYKMVYYHILP